MKMSGKSEYDTAAGHQDNRLHGESAASAFRRRVAEKGD